MNRAAFGSFAMACALVACAGGGGTPPATSTASPAPSPTSTSAPTHLYVGFAASSLPTLALAEYALPVTSASVPIAVIPSDGMRAVFAVDAARGTIAIAVANASGEAIQFFAPPLVATSVPIAQIPPGPATVPSTTALPIIGMSFDPAGDLWVATTSDLREFIAPFVSYSVAALIIPNGAATPALSNFTAQRPVFDPLGTMYVNDSTGATSTTGVFTIAPPYTVPPKRANLPMTVGPLAFDATGDAIASFTFAALPTPGPTGTPLPQSGMGVFALPLSDTSLPTRMFAAPMSPPPSGQRDDATSDGTTLYIANHNDGSFFTYQLPVNATDQPTARILCPVGTGACTGGILTMQLQLAP